MKNYKMWFELLAVVLSVLIGFQVAPVFAVALENDQSTTAPTKLQKPKTSETPKKNKVSEDVLFDNDIDKDQSARSYLISAISGGLGGIYGTSIDSYAGEVIAESRKITFDTVGNFGKELGIAMTSSGWSSSAEFTLASLFPGEQ